MGELVYTVGSLAQLTEAPDLFIILFFYSLFSKKNAPYLPARNRKMVLFCYNLLSTEKPHRLIAGSYRLRGRTYHIGI